jgi:hypothetical protein
MRYKLLRDLPGVSKGTIFMEVPKEEVPAYINASPIYQPFYSPKDFFSPQFSEYQMLTQKEWFEPIPETEEIEPLSIDLNKNTVAGVIEKLEELRVAVNQLLKEKQPQPGEDTGYGSHY